ncbi:uncharacterized protein LOC123987876 isoform X1 [Osmia bicornis bicornis]|uniref:uncharacterized protein LOC123987876 isoform X1 n=1 Tax=Osmia bicornis bicornis TaxID=1437191 RepID=UPI001EAF76D5|nr:uncharacterized protein LOC123987876 isoform X1 [Osmia bicornis bicornis]
MKANNGSHPFLRLPLNLLLCIEVRSRDIGYSIVNTLFFIANWKKRCMVTAMKINVFFRLENTRLSIHSAGLLPNTRYHLKCQCWHLISIAQIPYALTSQLLRFLRGSGIKGDDAHPGSEGVRQ